MALNRPLLLEFFKTFSESNISVVVPVFNEEKNLIYNLNLLISEIEPYFSNFEVLVINDGSTDGTANALKGYQHPKVQMFQYSTNLGKGHAVREGFKKAKGDFVLFIDGGMELHPKDIKIFLALLAMYEADIVLGSKRHPQSRVEYPPLRRFLSMLYQILIQKLFGLNVTDTQVGIKLFRKEVVDAILPDLSIDRYGFDLEMLALAKKKGFHRFLEAPITLDYFSFNERSSLPELIHVFRVGCVILKDTWLLYRKLYRHHSPAKPERDREKR